MKTVLEHDDGLRRKELQSPEGVPLEFIVAPAGSRLAAFLLDMMIIFAVLFALAIAMVIMAPHSGVSTGIWVVLWFLFVNFYFPLCELRFAGATLGKRAMGIRVIDRLGRPLDGGAVIARNFMRDFELWLPLQLLLLQEHHPFVAGIPEQVMPLFMIWVVVVLFFPLFNRDRLRVGDLIGGTMVVKVPRVRLLPDQSQRKDSDGFRFTKEQLEIYGIYELQVLEDLLRQKKAHSEEVIDAVYQKVARKIGWHRTVLDRRAFLEAFYKAQRERLEQKMLLGRRQERKAW